MHHDSPTSTHDPRSLMTMVEIPSRSRSSPITSSMATPQRSYYGADSSRSPVRSRSPHRSSHSPESPQMMHSRYEDSRESMPIVEPGTFIVKEEDDPKTDVVSLPNTNLLELLFIRLLIFNTFLIFSVLKKHLARFQDSWKFA